MKPIRWSDEKSTNLRDDKTRLGISFEECAEAIEDERLLDVIKNPSRNHPAQYMFVINVNNYAYCVPFVENEVEIFLKTVFPNRRLTNYYLKDAGREKSN